MHLPTLSRMCASWIRSTFRSMNPTETFWRPTFTPNKRPCLGIFGFYVYISTVLGGLTCVFVLAIKDRGSNGGIRPTRSPLSLCLLLHFFISLVLVPVNSLVWYVPSFRYTRGLGWRIHCGVEVTESSTNKQHIIIST
jgi:hypothetical protein